MSFHPGGWVVGEEGAIIPPRTDSAPWPHTRHAFVVAYPSVSSRRLCKLNPSSWRRNGGGPEHEQRGLRLVTQSQTRWNKNIILTSSSHESFSEGPNKSWHHPWCHQCVVFFFIHLQQKYTSSTDSLYLSLNQPYSTSKSYSRLLRYKTIIHVCNTYYTFYDLWPFFFLLKPAPNISSKASTVVQ